MEKPKSLAVAIGISLLIGCASNAPSDTAATSSESVSLNSTKEAALLDGRCGGDEWEAATKIDLPQRASILLMYDQNSLFICAKHDDGALTVLDLYVEHGETGDLHHFHLSAQMGEQVYSDGEWSESATWELKDYAGFWVPYFGSEETEDGIRPKFHRSSDRQVQILRRKFHGDTWNMMFALSISRDGEWVESRYPANALDTDPSTWSRISFSE